MTRVNNNWNCANDDADGVRLEPPAESSRVLEAEKSFAVGNAQAILATGGPSGAFLWAHLHGIHEDRQGESHYAVCNLIRDNDGFYYMISPVLRTTVEGVLDKPERHRHCYLQNVLPDSDEANWLTMAIDNGVDLQLEIAGDRDRDDIDWLTTTLKDILTEELQNLLDEYTAGAVGVLEVLRKINEGRTPPFLREKSKAHVK